MKCSTPSPPNSAFTKSQWMTVLVLSLAYLFSAWVTSLHAPFLPAEAEKKGASATEYGLVFGVFQLVCFLSSPIFGKYMNVFGAKKVFIFGIFIRGFSCFAFGFLDKIEGHFSFIFFAYLIRIIEAIGKGILLKFFKNIIYASFLLVFSTAFVTAAYTIIAGEFPDSVATTFASLETMYGLGLIVGPSVGGALFEVGGFIAPFVFVGLCLVAVSLMTPCLLPNGKSMSGGDCKGANGFGIFAILKIPAVQLAALNIWMGTNSIGYLSSTLEPHLRQFNFSAFQTGLIFMLTGVAYGVSAPLWGKLMDRVCHPKYVVVFGSLLLIAAHLLIGPAPFLPFDTYFPVTCVGLVLHGIGVTACQVSTFILALRESRANGFPDNLNLYSVVSGLWASFLSLGLFAGSSLGGVLYDEVGYRFGSLYPFIAAIIVLFLALLFLYMERRKTEQYRTLGLILIDPDNESKRLLQDAPEAVPKFTLSYKIDMDKGDWTASNTNYRTVQ